MSELKGSAIRIARPTSDMGLSLRFYVEGLGLEKLGSFNDHAGFDGTIVGFPGAPVHLEIVYERGRSHLAEPSDEDLVVFYVEEKAAFDALTARMDALGYKTLPSNNPYWDEAGCTFVDPDGYRVVIQNYSWPSQ